MRFWKFQYEGPEALAHCVSNRSLPSAERKFPGLKDTFAHPLKEMKPGDGLVLAMLDGDQGKIFALGRVRSTASDIKPTVVDWAPTTHTVFPEATGGLSNWQTKTAFEISPEPAKRYNLKSLVDWYVKDAG